MAINEFGRRAWAALRARPVLTGFYALMVALVGSFILLHTWGWGGWLNPISAPISTYTSTAPGKIFGTICMVILGILYLFLAAEMLPRMARSPAGRWACVFLAIAGALLFYVAVYQAPYQPQSNPPPPSWLNSAAVEIAKKLGFTPTDNIRKKEEEIIALTHGLMIASSTASLVLSQSLLVFALWDRKRLHSFARRTLIMIPVVAALFAMAFRQGAWMGLWQRAAFILVLIWLVMLARNFLVPIQAEAGNARA